MRTLYIDGDFDTAQPDGAKRWIAPFSGDQGDNEPYLYEQTYLQKISKWKPTASGTPSRDTDASGFVLVEETPLEPQGGGIGKWTRVYAEVPFPRTSWESYAWRMPGLTPDVSPFAIAISGTPTHSASQTTIATVSDHGLQVDDTVVIAYNIKHNAGTAETTHHIGRTVRSVPSRTSFVVDIIREQAVTWHSIRETGGRAPRTVVVTSKVEIDYHLAGTLGAPLRSPEQIPILKPDLIFNSLNEETDTYSPTTDPTLDEYKAKIAADEWIIAEASIIRRWRGPIYERSTRFVRAE